MGTFAAFILPMVGTDCNSAWGTQSQINLLMGSRSPGPTVKETPIFHHLGSHEKNGFPLLLSKIWALRQKPNFRPQVVRKHSFQLSKFATKKVEVEGMPVIYWRSCHKLNIGISFCLGPHFVSQ